MKRFRDILNEFSDFIIEDTVYNSFIVTLEDKHYDAVLKEAKKLKFTVVHSTPFREKMQTCVFVKLASK